MFFVSTVPAPVLCLSALCSVLLESCALCICPKQAIHECVCGWTESVVT